MNHLDLFSGIGGFALAAKWAGVETVAFCEINPYCQHVLRKNFGKDIKIYDDIRGLTADTSNTRIKNLRQKRQDKIPGPYGDNQRQLIGNTRIDILTGGFPCQPFSCAGRRRGKNDDRYLWPEMLRVISEFKPRWIIGENVGGLVNMAQWESNIELGGEADFFEEERKIYEREGPGILDGIYNDLESLGYEVQTLVIPACAVGAPHRRDRIWIVGHSIGRGLSGNPRGRAGKEFENRLAQYKQRNDSDTEGREKGPGLRKDKTKQDRTQFRNDCGNASDPISQYDDIGGYGTGEIFRKRRQASQVQGCEIIDHPERKRLEGHAEPSDKTEGWQEQAGSGFQTGWERNWLEVAAELCSLDDGLPVELGKLKLSKSKHREEQLKAYGNTIVPIIPYIIMKAIQEIKNGPH